MYKSFCALLLSFITGFSSIQFAIAEEEKKIIINPLAPPSTFSPHATLNSFLNSTEKAIMIIDKIYNEGQLESGLNYNDHQLKQADVAGELIELAIRTMNLSEIPEAQRDRIGLERVLMLREVIAHIQLPDNNQVPGASIAGNPSRSSDLPERWEIPGTEIAIELGKKGKYIEEYLFSVDTVDAIPEFYEELSLLAPVSGIKKPDFYHFYTTTPGNLLPYKWSGWLPGWSKNTLHLDQTLWQWLGLFLVLSFLLIFSKILIGWQFTHRRGLEEHTVIDVLIPITIIIFLWLGYDFIKYVLNITSMVFDVVSFVLIGTMYIVGSWLIYVVISYFSAFIWKASNVSSFLDKSVIDTLMKLISLIAATTVLYYGAVSLGIPIAPLVAGFGALGLAIGIGAQEYFKNVIGGLTLFIDRPVRVGETCEFQGITGSVENIGLRSTRIRTFDNRLVTVPNVIFSTSEITNYSRNRGQVLNKTLGLVYDTTTNQLNQILNELRDYLDAHDGVISQRVRLVDLGDFSLNIGVKVVLESKDVNQFFYFQEEFLFKSMAIVTSAGSDFAYPSQTIYMDQQ